MANTLTPTHTHTQQTARQTAGIVLWLHFLWPSLNMLLRDITTMLFTLLLGHKRSSKPLPNLHFTFSTISTFSICLACLHFHFNCLAFYWTVHIKWQTAAQRVGGKYKIYIKFYGSSLLNSEGEREIRVDGLSSAVEHWLFDSESVLPPCFPFKWQTVAFSFFLAPGPYFIWAWNKSIF